MTTVLDLLAKLVCPRCGRAVRVGQDRPLVDAEDVCILAVRCECGYQASVEAFDAADACQALLERVQSPSARPTRSRDNRRERPPLSPPPAAA